MQGFRIAPMCRTIASLTIVLLLVPVALLAAAAAGQSTMYGPAVAVVCLYAWIWLRMRPTRFVIHVESLEVVWPLRRQTLERSTISAARVLEAKDLKGLTGWGARIGAGGLWGGFGWLWTARRGIVQMYVSRTDRYVWLERTAERPWLITPEDPDAFVRALMR